MLESIKTARYSTEAAEGSTRSRSQQPPFEFKNNVAAHHSTEEEANDHNNVIDREAVPAR